jgi:hypothetical protein
MPEYLWSFEDLARFARFEDPEVRYWAADRLVLLYPDRASEAIAELLFDEHDTTPALVAEHLAKHGSESHMPLLAKGFLRASGILPGHCLAALASLGYAEAPKLARAALHRRDLDEEALAPIVAGLAEMAIGRGSEDAADAAREIVLRRPELYADPVALRGCLRIFGDDRLGDLAGKWITALHFRGIDSAESGIQALQENLQLEDVSWCLRTDRSGRVDLDRSLRSIENGYDCDVRLAIPREDRDALAAAFASGEFRAMTRRLAALVAGRARSVAAASTDPGDTLPARLAALASGFEREEVLNEAERLGHPMHTWVISLLLSALFKTAPYHNFERECARAEGDLEALLGLAELEGSALTRLLPSRLAKAAEAGGRERLEQWCLATLEARGPFFPKVVAIESLGEMRLSSQLPMILAYLSDDNAFVYAAAERALLKFGDEAVDAARAEIDRHDLHPDAMHSILVVLSDLMTPAALSLVLDHVDAFMEASGPEEGPELISLLGGKDLIPHLRRWLKHSESSGSKVAVRARIGHALLLVGAIHNVAIPEEEKILQAIDDYWKESPDDPAGGPDAREPYVM